ncbi:hypothetical protein EOS93_02455 [Rhizobium sp. RMa-01]|uniref:hypothetical protein n=1 Tax=unclassified Rhizobium TaxID=2613769 RepID=UPI0008DAA1EB|nr:MULTISPECIES: hypothetical protein [unclassified Rhizobium]OHV23708.1 hypothetical protein BBJ66_08675 [Rhizobium sp. RSm-3]RVU13717.1 hypothetical protein EOS93_02455 [Rhizobium sp. RMa-01]
MITDERKLEFELAIRKDLPRNVLVEAIEMFPIAAEQADTAVGTSHKSVANGLALSRRRQSRSAGILRHNIIDEAFEQILSRNGAEFVTSVPVEVTPDEIRQSAVYVTTGCFGQTMVGFASHREKEDAPSKNASRRALCSQNRGLSPDFFHPPEMFNDRKRLVLIMVRRDPQVLGKIASMTISLVDSKVESFICQWDINEFLAGYGAETAVKTKRPVAFKKVTKSFKDGKGDPAVTGQGE